MPSTISHVKVVAPRTLVLGAGGRLGTILRRYLAAGPYMWTSRTAGRGLIQLDILKDRNRLAQLAEQNDVILCLSGVSQGRGPLSRNTDLALRAVSAAVHTRHKTVFLCSSAAVYGQTEGPVREADKTSPATAYGKAKSDMEMAALQLGGQLGVRICNLRIGNVAGADAVLAGWADGFCLEVLPDGSTPVRSYIGPRDLAKTVCQLLRRWDAVPPSLNLALCEPVQMGALLDEAGLQWTPRAAPRSIVSKVEMDVSRLAALVDLPNPEDAASHIVKDWQTFNKDLIAA